MVSGLTLPMWLDKIKDRQDDTMKIHFYANFRTLVGGKSVEVDLPPGGNIAQVLAQLTERFPALHAHLFDERGSLLPHVHVFVNGRDLLTLPDGMQTRLDDADKVDIFPPVGGGSLSCGSVGNQ